MFLLNLLTMDPSSIVSKLITVTWNDTWVAPPEKKGEEKYVILGTRRKRVRPCHNQVILICRYLLVGKGPKCIQGFYVRVLLAFLIGRINRTFLRQLETSTDVMDWGNSVHLSIFTFRLWRPHFVVCGLINNVFETQRLLLITRWVPENYKYFLMKRFWFQG